MTQALYAHMNNKRKKKLAKQVLYLMHEPHLQSIFVLVILEI
jgi:hypothetical protein